MKPGVTIVMPAYNRAEVIGRTLDSIVAQSYRPLCVILVDNNSTDNTKALMDKWAQEHNSSDMIVRVVQETKKGACAARNRGLSMVESEWTMFFDSDDTMSPSHVERAMAAAARHPEVNMIGWDILMHGDDGRCERKTFADRDMAANCVLHGTLATQRYMARTELFRQAGGWSEDVEVWNDIELGIRLLPYAKAIKLSGSPTVDTYASGVDSITGVGFLSKGKEREHSIERIEVTLRPEQRWIVRLKLVVLAGLYRAEGGKDEATELIKKAISHEPSLWNRMLYRLAYSMYSHGIKGGIRMVRPMLMLT